eukprot:gene22905-30081_t
MPGDDRDREVFSKRSLRNWTEKNVRDIVMDQMDEDISDQACQLDVIAPGVVRATPGAGGIGGAPFDDWQDGVAALGMHQMSSMRPVQIKDMDLWMS